MELPRYFLFTLALYALTFLTSLVYFLIPSIQAGLFGFVEFYLITALMFLPLVFIDVYLSGAAKRYGTIIRITTTALAAAFSSVMLFVVLPLV